MFRGNDLIRIYNDEYEKIGVATREEIHLKGLLHQVAHIWMIQQDTANNDFWILFQKRSKDRDLYPGKYDLLQTTHIDPDETFEQSIVASMDYYLGTPLIEEDIKHIGNSRQQINEGNYHDNALVQVFLCEIQKAIFIMPNVEQIVKAHFSDVSAFINGTTSQLPIYFLNNNFCKNTYPENWWMRRQEFIDVVEPYIKTITKE